MKWFGLLLSALSLYAAPPDGIPRSLARERAKRVSAIRYHLQFNLVAHSDETSGHETLTFSLLDNTRPLLIDFREGTIQKLTLNGHALEPTIDNGHVQLPADYLLADLNRLEADFTAPVATAGKAITRYEDKDDGSEYIYSLFVPMDASMAFPCFDQPDLKGRFTLDLTRPADWTVIANVAPGQETQPISTYLFAFAAGPFQKVHPTLYQPDVYVRKSQIARAREEVPQIQQVTADGMKYLSDYFAQPFPFSKYDMVLIPGFPFGGMEHAGATFLNEDAMLFRSAPTETDRFGRNITVLHELTHQWFGDLVTMRWFDDLWLKEGFATYMAYHAMDEISPQPTTWAKFYQAIKPAAYAIDITQGTTPIYQDIPNLKDAKSAYGAIVLFKSARPFAATRIPPRAGEVSRWLAFVFICSCLWECGVERSCTCSREIVWHQSDFLGRCLDSTSQRAGCYHRVGLYRGQVIHVESAPARRNARRPDLAHRHRGLARLCGCPSREAASTVQSAFL